MLNSFISSALGLIFGGTITWIIQNHKINLERKEKLNISMWQVYAAFQEYPVFEIAITDLESFKQNNYKKMRTVFFDRLHYLPIPIKEKFLELENNLQYVFLELEINFSESGLTKDGIMVLENAHLEYNQLYDLFIEYLHLKIKKSPSN
ncbi:hypothetical protein IBB48_00875 [Listeria welshimeri]|uniref:hypothetical protein n=1 Tax=Listeria welshimeri TaxID=1643 RepID=UPI001888681A|nr:hypothetical protein [Listeria welshimeri]MBF2601316.1 hypothetical protein [Listeria welshimeri]